MIGVLLLSSSFLIIVLIAVLIMALHMKRWSQYKDEQAQKKFEELTKRIDETQRLFKNEVSNILDNFRKFIK